MFDKAKVTLLNKVLEWLTGKEAFNYIKNVVDTLMSENMSGEEKRKFAFEQIRNVFQTTSSVLINLAIEAAVYIIKQQLLTKKVVK